MQNFGGTLLSKAFESQSGSNESFLVAFGQHLCHYDSNTGNLLSRSHACESDIITFKNIAQQGVVSGSTKTLLLTKNGQLYQCENFSQLKILNRISNLTSIKQAIFCSARSNTSVYVVSAENKALCILDINTAKDTHQQTIRAFKPDTKIILELSKNENYVLLGINSTQNQAVHLYSTVDNILQKKVEHFEPITCLAMSFNEKHIVVGSVSGKITIFSDILRENINIKEKKSLTYHWHSHAVSSVRYSNDDSVILSGGSEGVLLLQHQLSDRRDFLPRLGALITGIFTFKDDASRVAVYLASNQLKIVQLHNFSVAAVVSGVLNPLAFSGKSEREIGARKQFLAGFQQKSFSNGLFATNSVPGSLQLIDLWRAQCLAEIPIVQRNLVLGSEQPKPLEIVAFKFDEESFKNLAVCVQRSGRQQTLSQLKFYVEEIQHGGQFEYRLQTRVDEPHGHSLHQIESKFMQSSQKLVFATIGSDRKYRIWMEKFWNCAYEGSYKDLELFQLAFSCKEDNILYLLADNVFVVVDIARRRIACAYQLQHRFKHFAIFEEQQQVFLVNEKTLQVLYLTDSVIQNTLNFTFINDLKISKQRKEIALLVSAQNVLRFKINEEGGLSISKMLKAEEALEQIFYFQRESGQQLIGVAKGCKFFHLEEISMDLQIQQIQKEDADNRETKQQKQQLYKIENVQKKDDQFDSLYQEFLDFNFQNELSAITSLFNKQSHLIPPLALVADKVLDNQLIKSMK